MPTLRLRADERPLLLDLHVAVLRDALAETRAADDATRRLALREDLRPLPAHDRGARASSPVAKETRELAVPGPDDALTYLGDGWRRATPALAWTRRDYTGHRGGGGGGRARAFSKAARRTALAALAARSCERRRRRCGPRRRGGLERRLRRWPGRCGVVGARARRAADAAPRASSARQCPSCVGAPRTARRWWRSLGSVPRPGLLIVDADRGCAELGPDDADLVRAARAEAVEGAVEEMVRACRRARPRRGAPRPQGGGPRRRELCGAANRLRWRSTFARTRRAICERARGRESPPRRTCRRRRRRRARRSVRDLREAWATRVRRARVGKLGARVDELGFAGVHQGGPAAVAASDASRTDELSAEECAESAALCAEPVLGVVRPAGVAETRRPTTLALRRRRPASPGLRGVAVALVGVRRAGPAAGG